VREDLSNQGIQTLYLITDHTEFYEKCGWRFLTLVKDEGTVANSRW
ncbi:GNAT family N-acetyltransferase, partial [Acinetobacter baumannii]|nr:GNAT family N-acetyltransferase [Acinetobacter baumannii]